MEKKTIRERLQEFFSSDKLILKLWETFIFAMIFISIMQLLAEYNFLHLGFTLTPDEHHWIDFGIALIFSLDYALRFYASESRRKYFLNWFNMIDLVAIIPSFLGFGQLKSLRTLRVLRSLRFLRIVHIIKSLDIVDNFEVATRADDEVAFYNRLTGFFVELVSKKSVEKKKALVLELQKNVEIARENAQKKLSKESENVVISTQTFLLAYYEILEQIEGVLRRFHFKDSKLSMMKLKYLVRELGLLLKSEHPKEEVKELPAKFLNPIVQFLRLLKISVRDILVTFSFAIAANVIISFSDIHFLTDPFVQNLGVIEAGMGALIVFITSFNMSYTNNKRATVDLAAIDFTNLLLVYATRIKELLKQFEEDPKKRAEIFRKVDEYYNYIGADILTGIRKGNPYNLRFDMAIIECMDRIKALIDPYKRQSEANTRVKTQEIEAALMSCLNRFQTISGIRAAKIFDVLNHWIIRITYFLLTAFSPFSAIPRLFVVNLMQRAFYRTANETDNAIFTVSLARLPIKSRILRRLCRISTILNVD